MHPPIGPWTIWGLPQDTELRFRKAILLHELGRLEEAARLYQDILEVREERHFTSVDRAIAGFKARQNLAVVYRDMGDLDRAEEQWRRIVQDVPQYRQGWRGLGDVLLQQCKLENASELAEQLLHDDYLHGEGVLLTARLAATHGDVEGARREVEQLVKNCPDDAEPLRFLSQLLFEHGDPSEALRLYAGNLDATRAIQQILQQEADR